LTAFGFSKLRGYTALVSNILLTAWAAMIVAFMR
jgi:hypothetical protein